MLRMCHLARYTIVLGLIVAISPMISVCEGQGSSAGGTREAYDFEKFGGIEYCAGEDYCLTLDVYVPEGAGPHPAILAVHGGSWRSGTKLHWFRHARKMARAGFVVVAINYRHAPAHKFPAQIHDCKAAVRWMRMNADTYKIDTERIGGVGYSAGGHLVALLGTSEPGDGLEGNISEAEKGISTRLQAVACGGAPCDFTWVSEDARTLEFWLGDTKGANPEIYRLATPTSFITPDDPPFHFFQGTADLLVPESSPRRMHDLLQQHAVDSEYLAYEGYGHIGLFSHIDAMEPVIEFFDRELRK